MKKRFGIIALVSAACVLLPGVAWAAKPKVPGGVYFGAATNYIWNGDDKQEILTRENQIGRKYAVDHQFFEFVETWWTDGANMVDWDLSQGRIPLLTWGCPRVDGQGRSGSRQIALGLHDAQIDRWAAAIRARQKPMFLRYCSEMDAPYKADNAGTPTDFIASWRRIWTRFNAVVNGVRANDYVAWSWVTTAIRWTSPEGVARAKSYYPGDAYVDWIGADGYNFYGCFTDTWKMPTDIFGGWYNWAKNQTKPLMIPEFGTVEHPSNPSRKPEWINAFRSTIKNSYTKVHLIAYLDTAGAKGCNWRLDSSAQTLDAWRQMGQDPYFQGQGDSGGGGGGGDTTAPSVPKLASPTSTFQLQRDFGVSWSSTDSGSGVASYDLRYRGAPYNRGFGSYVTWKSATSAKSASFTGTPGYTYCLSARATDNAGNVSGWSAERCTAVPLDDRGLAISSGSWTRNTGTGYFLDTHTDSSNPKATLEVTGVQARRLAIIVTTCSTCGDIEVRWSGTLLDKLSLKSSTTRKKVLISLASFTSVRTGTVEIEVSTGKLVKIDGLAVSQV